MKCSSNCFLTIKLNQFKSLFLSKFHRMNPFQRSKDYEDSRRIVDYSSTFNTDTKLEFNILPDKRYLSLQDTLLTFSVELPEEVIPDNFLGSTVFENLGR